MGAIVAQAYMALSDKKPSAVEARIGSVVLIAAIILTAIFYGLFALQLIHFLRRKLSRWLCADLCGFDLLLRAL